MQSWTQVSKKPTMPAIKEVAHAPLMVSLDGEPENTVARLEQHHTTTTAGQSGHRSLRFYHAYMQPSPRQVFFWQSVKPTMKPFSLLRPKLFAVGGGLIVAACVEQGFHEQASSKHLSVRIASQMLAASLYWSMSLRALTSRNQIGSGVSPPTRHRSNMSAACQRRSVLPSLIAEAIAVR